ncbi:MAG: ABC-2 family transporter protein [Spirochaetes bacterium]|nr:ABC-2 family transporter protein [Spirochaetota bacterium]
MNGFNLYGRYFAANMRAQMQYRMSFLLLTAASFIGTGIEVLGLLALFGRFGSLKGFSFPEILFFYGIINIAFAFAEFFGRGFITFSAMVKSGNFDRVLLRPRSAALQISANELQFRRIGRLAQGLAAFVAACVILPVHWHPLSIVLLFVTVAGGAALFVALFMLQATLCFWSTETLEIANTVTYGGVETGQYPMSIYKRRFREFFTVIIPLACVSFYPALAMLGRTDPGGMPLVLQYLSPLAGFVFLGFALVVWKFGVRHYRSTGS